MGKHRIGGIACRLLCALVAWGSISAQARDYSAISVEAETGLVLYEHDADFRRPPASMIKLMLLLLVVEGIEGGDWSLETEITATRHAQRMGGTQVFLAQGETISLDKLMYAVAVSSANDAAMAVAEGLWGSEEAYLAVMNRRTLELGMASSEFHSVHGLPPDRGESPDRTTARDMALLGRECVKYPQLLRWTSTIRYQFRDGEELRYTTNKLTRRMPASDGLKTGFISAAGFCITATAQRDDIRIVAVVMGHDNKEERFDLAERLLNSGLGTVQKDRIVVKGETPLPSVSVENSEIVELTLEVPEDIWVTVKKEDWGRIGLAFDHPSQVQAPIAALTELGTLSVVLDGKVLARSTLIAPVAVEEAGWMWKLERAVKSLFSAD